MEHYTPPPVPPQKSGNNTQVLGILALVAGIISLPVSFIPCFGFIAFVVAIVAIVLGILTITSAKKHNESKGLGIAGIALGSISFLILLVWGALLAMFTTAAIKNIDDIQKEMDSLNTDEQEYFYDDEGTEEDSLQSDEETYFIGE